jgi:hypothetical protein
MPRKQKKYHYIYKTTCLVTGKFYVGMHSTDNLEDDYLGSGKILGYSRKKYGDENHVREIIEMLPSREALKAREKEIVNEELLADTLNINLKYGGDGGWENVNHARTPEMWSAMGKARRAKSTGNNGKTFDAAWREKISRSNKGKQAFLGKTHSQEAKSAISSANKKMVGKMNSQFGTRWAWVVHENQQPLKIRLDDLEKYLAKGYKRGMKFNTLF